METVDVSAELISAFDFLKTLIPDAAFVLGRKATDAVHSLSR